jgi:hypothetical protein
MQICKIYGYGSYVVEGEACVRAAATAAVLVVPETVEEAEEEVVMQLESPAPTVNCEAGRINIGRLRSRPTEYVQIQTMLQYHH